MKTKWIALLVIAALLTTGVAAAAPATTEQDLPFTAQDAQAVALAHAEKAEEQVTGLRSVYDVDDGITEYEVKFRNGDWEYEYTVHAETGQVLEADRDYTPRQEQTTPPPAPAETAPAPLTAQEAVAIALSHAGLTAQQVKELEYEQDTERGVILWEVEFEFGGWEYEYDIDATTDNILKAEKDRDD